MPAIPRPSPCFLDDMDAMGARSGEKRWRSPDRQRWYTWDFTHGEIEVFEKRGNHLGAADAVTGVFIKPARKGRRIDV